MTFNENVLHYHHAFLPSYFHLWNILLAFVAGLVGESIGALVGGGSIFIMSALIFMGLPLQAAVATDNASALGTEIGILSETYRKVVANKKLFFIMAIPMTAGGIIGTYLLLTLSATLIKDVMVGGVVFILVHTFFSKDKSDVHAVSKSDYATLMVFLFIMGLYLNFIGVGSGTFGRIAIMSILGLSFMQSQGLIAAATMPTRIYSFVVTSFFGLIVWPYLLTLWCSNYIAGKYATKAIKHIPDASLKIILTVLSIIFVIYLLFFY